MEKCEGFKDSVIGLRWVLIEGSNGIVLMQIIKELLRIYVPIWTSFIDNIQINLLKSTLFARYLRLIFCEMYRN